MKIVNIIGGLGNQMFQYAFALSLQKQFPEEQILIDTSHFNYLFFKKIGNANLHNGYEIETVFPNASLKKANPFQLLKVTWYMPNYILSRVLRRIIPKRKSEYIQSNTEYFEYKKEPLELQGNVYYEGIWESVHYLNIARSEIQHTFAHPTPDISNAEYIRCMESENSVGIHVRRGDYLLHPNFSGICDLDYYKSAIREIQKDDKRHIFYIFSNDMMWCKENLSPLIEPNKIVYVTSNTGIKSCWDMFLMSHCKDLIIANSSFSWWGAFLNKRKGRVVAPKKWVNREAKYDIWLDDWIRL